MSLNRAISDFKRFSQGDFSVEISFTTPDDSKTSVVKGLASRHHLNFDSQTGLPVNTANVHVSVSESLLVEDGYPVRNSKKEVAMSRHLVKWTDASGEEREYLIDQVRPSDTVGFLIFIIGGYNGS